MVIQMFSTNILCPCFYDMDILQNSEPFFELCLVHYRNFSHNFFLTRGELDMNFYGFDA